ncbi:hypothetical protein MMC26_007314 [Xylographa opegraphella]|nr:hypothetical protein [Xylographa opegraphella]
MDPKKPAQPSIDTSYDTAGNPAEQTSHEESIAAAKSSTNTGATTEDRGPGDIPIPSTHDSEATPSSLGIGARDASGDKGEEIGPAASNLDGEQMRATGEGDVYKQQFSKSGFGEQDDLAGDLDRKKAEQASARAEVKSQRKDDVDVGGALGNRVGPSVVEGR